MDIEFLLKTDFLGIVSNLVAIKKQILDENHEINFRDLLIEVRRTQAQFESFLCSDEPEVILEHNRTPWNTLHDGVEERMLGSDFIKKIFGFVPESNKNVEKYFESYKHLGRGIYKIKKNKPVQKYKNKIIAESVNTVVKTSKIHQYYLNICSNHTQTGSNFLQQRLGLSCELCDVLNDKKFLTNMFSESTLQEYFQEDQVLTIIPYIGKANENILKFKPMTEFSRTLMLENQILKEKIKNPSLIYLICHFRSEQYKSLENIGSEIDIIFMDIIVKNEEVKRIFKRCSRIDDEENSNNNVYLNKFLVRNNTRPNDVGIVFFVTFVESLLEKLDGKKISNMFYSNLKEANKTKWEIHFSDDERNRFIV